MGEPTDGCAKLRTLRIRHNHSLYAPTGVAKPPSMQLWNFLLCNMRAHDAFREDTLLILDNSNESCS